MSHTTIKNGNILSRIPLYFWFLIPAFLIILFFLVYPMVYQIYLSVFSTTFYSKGSFVGLNNYIKVLKDKITQDSFKVTVSFVALSTLFEIAWGLVLAIVFNTITRGKKFLRGILIVPLMLTPVAVGSIWNLMFFPEGGVINTVFKAFSISQQTWLSSPISALFSLVLVEIWQYTPFTALVLLAGLQSIPRELYEASNIDGASKFQDFHFITLPLLKSLIFLAILFNIMRQFKAFDIVYTVTKGGPGRATNVISFYIYQKAFRFYNISEAAALSFIVLAIVLIISNVFLKIFQSTTE